MSSRPSSFALTHSGPLQLFSTRELLTLPPPTWQIADVIPSGGFVAMYGPPGCGKSFLSLDIALCIATGRDWFGHPVERGTVVYIGAEGGSGISKRVRAWLQANNVDAKDAAVSWMLEPMIVNANSDDMAVLMDRIVKEAQLTPSLIVVDTLNRCFDGDENTPEDMGLFIAGVDHLRHKLGCTVLVVHHSRLDGTRERGHTSFRGAADTVIAATLSAGQKLTVDQNYATLECIKQKDAEGFKEFDVELKVVGDTESCVLVSSNGAEEHEQAVELAWFTLRQMEPCRWNDWKDATQLEESPFAKVARALQVTKRIEKGKKDMLWRTITGAKQPLPHFGG